MNIKEEMPETFLDVAALRAHDALHHGKYLLYRRKHMNNDNALLSIENEAREMSEMKFITADNSEFFETKGGFVGLNFMGISFDRVKITRLFPFTDSENYISIRTSDENPKEIGIIRDLSQMPEKTAEIIRKQLNLTYFTPVIQKILNIKKMEYQKKRKNQI